jgi:hypothetical protein
MRAAITPDGSFGDCKGLLYRGFATKSEIYCFPGWKILKLARPRIPLAGVRRRRPGGKVKSSGRVELALSPLFGTHQDMAIRFDNLVWKLALSQRASANSKLLISNELQLR